MVEQSEGIPADRAVARQKGIMQLVHVAGGLMLLVGVIPVCVSAEDAPPTREVLPRFRRIVMLGEPGSVPIRIAFSPDGTLLAAHYWTRAEDSRRGSRRNLKVWNVGEWRTRGSLSDGTDLSGFAFSRDSRLVYISTGAFSISRASAYGGVRALRVDAFICVANWEGLGGGVNELGLSADGQVMALVRSRRIRLVRISSLKDADKGPGGRVRDVLSAVSFGLIDCDKEGLGAFNCMAYSPDCTLLAYAGGKLGMCSVATQRFQYIINEEATSLAFAASGKVWADGLKRAGPRLRGVVKIRDISNGNVNYEISHEGEPTSLGFSPDGSWLAVGSGRITEAMGTSPMIQGDVQVWNAHSFRNAISLSTAASAPVSFSPDGRLLATGWEDGRIVVWSLEY